jgi:hypothetical protein
VRRLYGAALEAEQQDDVVELRGDAVDKAMRTEKALGKAAEDAGHQRVAAPLT